jgi:two-component system LytT family response regulator
MIMRVLVVDDEPLARSSLRMLLKEDPAITWIGECGGGEEALHEVKRARPDLMFLDVKMPEVDGFQVLQALGAEAPVTVFVTAFDEHAIRAFDAGAIDYLLKPFDDARFTRALKRAKERLSLKAEGRFPPLKVKALGRTLYLEQADVDWVEAADYYACVHANGKSHLLRRSLKELECELDPKLFLRVHRSAIVNCSKVRAIHCANDEGEAELSSGVRVPLSRRYRGGLKQRLEERA